MPCTLLESPVALPPWRELTRAAHGILQYLMKMNLEATLEKLLELGRKLKTAEDVMETELRSYRDSDQMLLWNLCDML